MRRLGDIERIELEGELAGITVLVRHVGMLVVAETHRKLEAARVREIPRILELQKQIPENGKHLAPKNWFPESFKDLQMVSDKGVEEEAEIERWAISKMVAGFEGHERPDADVIEELDRWGLRSSIAWLALSLQSLNETDPLAARGREPPVG